MTVKFYNQNWSYNCKYYLICSVLDFTLDVLQVDRIYCCITFTCKNCLKWLKYVRNASENRPYDDLHWWISQYYDKYLSSLDLNSCSCWSDSHICDVYCSFCMELKLLSVLLFNLFKYYVMCIWSLRMELAVVVSVKISTCSNYVSLETIKL